MILIRKIEIEEVKDDFAEVVTFKDFCAGKLSPNAKAEKIKVCKEIVYGTRFINERGQDVCIDTTLEVQKTIGLCFQTFRNQLNKIHEQSQQIRGQQKIIEKLEDQINTIVNMSFIQRLKFLFKGK